MFIPVTYTMRKHVKFKKSTTLLYCLVSWSFMVVITLKATVH